VFVARKTCGDTPLDCRLISFTRLRAPVQRDSFKKEMAVASDFFDRPRVHVSRNATPIGMFQGLLRPSGCCQKPPAGGGSSFEGIPKHHLQTAATVLHQKQRPAMSDSLTTVSTLQALMMGTPVVPRYLV